MSIKKDVIVTSDVKARDFDGDLAILKEALEKQVEKNEITKLQRNQIIENFIAYQNYLEVKNYIFVD